MNDASTVKAAFQWDDPFLLDDQLTEEERMIRDTARAYVQDRLAPRVLNAFENETAYWKRRPQPPEERGQDQ